MELNAWDDLFLRIDRIREKILGKKQYAERFRSEIEFATKLSLRKGRKNWKRLVREALERSETGIVRSFSKRLSRRLKADNGRLSQIPGLRQIRT